MAGVAWVEFGQVFAHKLNVNLPDFEVLVVQKLVGDVESFSEIDRLLHEHFYGESAHAC